MRLLLVEYDAALRGSVTSCLTEHGVRVTAVATAAAARTKLHQATFDVAILDLTHDEQVEDLLRTLCELTSSTHVIVLGAAAGETDRVRALELGADDYVVTPFYVRELTARVLAVRRRRDLVNGRTSIRCGPIVIDLAARQVTVNDVDVVLSAKEFALLAFLAARAGHVFSHDELLREVWHSTRDWQQASTVTEHVHRLRAKIERDPQQPRWLQTVRGAGYRFDRRSVD